MTAHQSSVDNSSRRLKMIVGIGVGIGVALFIGSKLMSGGSDAGTQSSLGASGATPTPTTVAGSAPAPADSAPEPVETFEVFTTKNPFMPLRSATAASAGPAPAATAPAAAAPLPVVAPVATVAAPTATPAPAPATAPIAPAASGGQATEPSRTTTRVALLDVFADGDRILANVRVNDTVSRVGAGDTFGTNFKVVSLDAGERCGRFLFGDDQFRLCKGEEVLK